MNKITMVLPYYEAPRMLGLQVMNLLGYPRDVRQLLTVIVVDDGSPHNPAYDVVGRWTDELNLQLYCVKQDIPWNAHGARNLGFMQAPEDGWVLGLDVKHIVPAHCMEWLTWKWEPEPGHYYTFPHMWFGRKGAGRMVMDFVLNRQGLPTKPHPNTFLVRREDFWAAGGYNEDFCGTYGGDGEFVRRLGAQVDEMSLPPTKFWIVRVDRSVVEDSMALVESRSYFKSLYHKVKASGKRPERPLRFSWDRIL